MAAKIERLEAAVAELRERQDHPVFQAGPDQLLDQVAPAHSPLQSQIIELELPR
jgi:hypothetical protein